jgi:hypothetical protein
MSIAETGKRRTASAKDAAARQGYLFGETAGQFVAALPTFMELV